MRFSAIVLLAACHSASSGTPSNRAGEPDLKATIADELGFLPGDAELVGGLDFVQLRGTDLWKKFEPQIRAQLDAQIAQFAGGCKLDVGGTVERITFGLSFPAPNRVTGVLVVRGVDSAKAVECAKANKTTPVTDDGGVLVTKPAQMQDMVATVAVDAKTVVMQIGATANRETMRHVTTSGTPLRGSQAFMGLYGRRERGATLWGMANGSSKIFDGAANAGFRPTSVDGTLTVADRFTLAARGTFASADEAGKLAKELNQVAGMARAMVDKLAVNTNGTMVTADVVITEAQLRRLMSMAGGMMP